MKTQNTKITKNIVLALLAISSINASPSYNTNATIIQVKQNSLINEGSNIMKRVALEDIKKSLNDFSKTQHGFVSKEMVLNHYNTLVNQLKDNSQITLDDFFFSPVTIKKDNTMLKIKVGTSGYEDYAADSLANHLSQNAHNIFSIKRLLEEIKQSGYGTGEGKKSAFNESNEKNFNEQIKNIESLINKLSNGTVYSKIEKAEEDKTNISNNKQNRETVIKEFYSILNQAKKDGALETTVKLNNGLNYNFNKKNVIIVSSIVAILLALAALAYYYYV